MTSNTGRTTLAHRHENNIASSKNVYVDSKKSAPTYSVVSHNGLSGQKCFYKASPTNERSLCWNCDGEYIVILV